MENNIMQSISFSGLTNWSIQYLLKNTFSYNQDYELISIGKFLKRNKTHVLIEDDVTYKRVTIKVNNGGVFVRKKGVKYTTIGSEIGTKKQFRVKEGQFLLSKIDARNGAFGVVPKEVNNAVITGNFWTFDVDYKMINPHFLSLIVTTPEFIQFCENASNGTTNRHYLQESLFLGQKIPLPPLSEQNKIVKFYKAKIALAKKQEEKVKKLEIEIENYLFDALGLEKLKKTENLKGLQFVHFKDIPDWNSSSRNITKYNSNKFLLTSLLLNQTLAINVFRGKSPKYDKNGKSLILNQKCNRWNYLEREHSKTVNDKWFNSIDENFFTKEGDILINSTGEGTIGRSTLITKENENLLYDSHILLLRLDQQKVDPKFYSYLFNSKYGQQQVEDIKSAQSTKQTELGVNNLKKIMFPLPKEIEVQVKISKHISKLKIKIKSLKEKAKENRKQAILDFENKIFN